MTVKKRVVKRRRVEAVAEDEGEEILGAEVGTGMSALDMLSAEVSRQSAVRQDLQEEAAQEQAEEYGEQGDDSDSGEIILTETGLGRKRKQLWQDDDDTNAKPVTLTSTVAATARPTPVWAEIPTEGANDDDDDDISDEDEMDAGIYGDTKGLVDRKKMLPSGALDYQLVKDGNEAEVSHAALSAVHFHPNGTILLTASPDYRLRLFQTDGTSSTKLQTVNFKNLPPMQARFTPCGSRIICSGKRPEYAVVDVESSTVSMVTSLSRQERNLSVFACSPHGGAASPIAFCSQTGSINFVSSSSHQPLFALKGEGPSNAVAFNSEDENQVWSIGGNKVYVWDVRTRRPLRIHADEGSQLATTLDVSGAANMYAVGSSNGVVNMYDIPGSFPANPLEAAPAPRKALLSLTTETQFTSFNSQGDILCMGSEKKKNAVRLVHTASQTIFANFPRVNHHYRKATCCDFSPSSGMLCLGNDRGRAMLFRLSYYGSA